MEENRIPKRVLYMNLGTTRLRGRPRNIWGYRGWKEKVRNTGMVEAPENGKESSNSAYANGMKELLLNRIFI